MNEIEEINPQEEIEKNKRPPLLLRLVGGLIDGCLVFLTTILLNAAFTKTSLGDIAESYRVEMINIQDEYKLLPLVEGSDECYGHKLYSYEDGYENYSSFVSHTDTIGEYVVVNNDNISSDVKNAFESKVKGNENYQTASFNYRLVNYGIMMICASISEAVLFLVIPLVNKRRATIGKLVTGTQLINNKFEVKARWYQVVGAYAFILIVETAIPYLFIQAFGAILVPVIKILFIGFSQKGRTIRDIVTNTMVIDKKTFVPYFETKKD